ncbi:MAG: 2-dehydropantoate 2-reductase [Myxococcota bacterium]
MTDHPRILVVGLGGIGGTIAGRLLARGYDVVGISTNPTICTAIEQHGFRLEGHGGSRAVPGRAVASLEPQDTFDLILLATQPPQVEAASRTTVGHLSPSGALVVLQNGLCEERIARIVGASKVLGAVVSWGASMVAPGVYRRTSSGGFTVGSLENPDDSRVVSLARVLEAVGPVKRTRNLRGARWTKLAFNCAVSTLGTIGGDRLGPLMRHRFVRRLGMEVMTEVVRVAGAESVRLEKLAGTISLSSLTLSGEAQSRAGLVGKHVLLMAAGLRYRRLRSSMLAAIERGRPPAVDFLNGEIVNRAVRYHIDVPLNRRLVETVHGIADKRLSSSLFTLRSVYEDTR